LHPACLLRRVRASSQRNSRSAQQAYPWLARSAVDLDLVLSIIAEPVVGEDMAWRLMFPPVRHSALADFRIAVLPPVPWLPVDGEILAALDDLTARLRRLGAWVEEMQPEGFDLWQHHEAYSMLLSVIAFAHLDGDERAHVVEVLHQSFDRFANAQLVGVNATVSQFIGMHGRRSFLFHNHPHHESRSVRVVYAHGW
jgi:amidase